MAFSKLETMILTQKRSFLYLLVLLFFLSTNSTFSQLVIDAGNDTTICSTPDPIILGGNPTAYGGVAPYKYEWSVYSDLNGNPYPADLFLSDSSAANPALSNTDYLLNDILIVRLVVTDSIGNIEIDSTQVGISSIGTRTLMYCWYTILSGDSVMVHVCNQFMGMSPFTYHWTPEGIFSDPHSQNPYAKPDTTTIINVELTDVIGCSASENYVIHVNSVGINTIANSFLNSIVVPNPINELSKIVIDGPYPTLSIKIYDLKARLVVDDYFSDNSYEVGSVIHEQGMYLYIISEESKVLSVGKFIKN